MPHSFFNIINSLQKSNQQISIMLSQNQLHQLNQEKSKVLLSQQLQRYHYYGLLEEYQLHPTSITNNFKYTKLNSYQHFLFKRVLHGLNVYTKEEVKKLHWDKKRRISKVWKRSQREINAWKQTITNKRVNGFFAKTFRGPAMEFIISVPCDEILEDYHNKLTFKELDIELFVFILLVLCISFVCLLLSLFIIPYAAEK